MRLNEYLWSKGLKEKVYKHTYARTWLSLYKSIINRVIKEIRIHKSNFDVRLCILHTGQPYNEIAGVLTINRDGSFK